jgi:hypothetical protein
MTGTNKMRLNIALAACCGLGLRLLFVLKFPDTDSGDAPFYIELAWNWLRKGVYGLVVNNKLIPVDMRTPGYPAFLAGIFVFVGNSQWAVMFVQAFVDLVTCILIAFIAARLSPLESRRRVFLAGLWLAALCPFIANYSAVVLTETLVTFLTALALLLLMETDVAMPDSTTTLRWPPTIFLAGIIVGFGTLVRPETPLLLAAAGIGLALKQWRPRDWTKLARAGVLMAVGLALPLVPWAVRNWRTLHKTQFLAPRDSLLPGEFAPQGFRAWTDTWLWRMRDVYLVTWNLNSNPISIDDIPSTAFDSSSERERICDILDAYNNTETETIEMDAAFGQIARERTARHPFRTYVKIPALRFLALWFTPRTELLPVTGHLWPLGAEWEDDPPQFVIAVAFVAINALFVLLALAGARKFRSSPAVRFLLIFILLRTVFFAVDVDTPEPRYVLECFPAVIALGALFFERKTAHDLSFVNGLGMNG